MGTQSRDPSGVPLPGFTCAGESVPGVPGPGELLCGGLVSGTVQAQPTLRGQDPKGNLRLRENPGSRINVLSLESSVFSVLWASRGPLCSEMLSQPLQGCMLPPEPEMQTLPGAIAGATQDPNTAIGCPKTLQKGLSQGTGTKDPPKSTVWSP